MEFLDNSQWSIVRLLYEEGMDLKEAIEYVKNLRSPNKSVAIN